MNVLLKAMQLKASLDAFMYIKHNFTNLFFWSKDEFYSRSIKNRIEQMMVLQKNISIT